MHQRTASFWGITLTLFLLCAPLNAQKAARRNPGHKYVATYYPSKATKVEGLMLLLYNPTIPDSTAIQPRVNGIQLDINPLGIATPLWLAMESAGSRFRTPYKQNESPPDYSTFKRINGLRIGLLDGEDTLVNGIDISVNGSIKTKVNGLAIGVVTNKHYELNGISIALLGTTVSKGGGVQIGLFNRSGNMKGFQLGLWNKNSKRSLPFINWSF